MKMAEVQTAWVTIAFDLLYLEIKDPADFIHETVISSSTGIKKLRKSVASDTKTLPTAAIKWSNT